MKTQIIKINEKNIDQKQMELAGHLAQQGELVAFPTETVYGLGADALNKEASKKIYAAKGRPSDNPLIVHVADFDAIHKIVKEVPQDAEKLAKAFWPGPLTMTFFKNDQVPDETTGGLNTVAIRMPNHKVALEFIRAAGGYIAAPSANTSGRPSPTLAEHVYEDMKGKIPMILDGGQVGIGIESTIVDFTGDEISILRPGYITKEMIEKVLDKKIIIDPAVDGSDPNAKPKAPGMKYRHYAPKASLSLVEGSSDAVREKMLSLAKEAVANGQRCGIMATKERLKDFENLDESIRKGLVLKELGHEDDEASVARELYLVLREFDKEEVHVIYSESFADEGVGKAIMNRLIRAAGHQVIKAD
ncbi:MAG: threonylcarbamoyl-AMP synthase [Lachnospiraceae bacterium]|nr:threonylcarbamoyl-AMP synthase [Lachnospiraceae bacterium]